jgi:hypothetical protein
MCVFMDASRVFTNIGMAERLGVQVQQQAARL